MLMLQTVEFSVPGYPEFGLPAWCLVPPANELEGYKISAKVSAKIKEIYGNNT